jgi:NAD(P)H-dependent flavin oxidoreductase YrpB (nitropropane dioxygenase family)
MPTISGAADCAFAINLWVSMEDEGARTSDEAAFNRSLALLRHHLAALGAPQPVYTPYVPMRFEDQARVLLDADVPVFSFIYGIPPREILDECRNKHIVTIGTATTPDEASMLQEAGVCEESGASRLHREALLRRDAGHTGLTRGFTGRLARGIDNALMQQFNQTGTEILPYPLQRGLVRHLSVAAGIAGRSDLLPLWAGQSAGLSACTDVSVFLQSLLEEVSAIAGPISDWSAKYREHHPTT